MRKNSPTSRSHVVTHIHSPSVSCDEFAAARKRTVNTIRIHPAQLATGLTDCSAMTIAALSSRDRTGRPSWPYGQAGWTLMRSKETDARGGVAEPRFLDPAIVR